MSTSSCGKQEGLDAYPQTAAVLVVVPERELIKEDGEIALPQAALSTDRLVRKPNTEQDVRAPLAETVARVDLRAGTAVTRR